MEPRILSSGYPHHTVQGREELRHARVPEARVHQRGRFHTHEGCLWREFLAAAGWLNCQAMLA